MDDYLKKIILTGNPNSGKSAIFSRLTSVDVISSNYPGTTIELMKGNLKVRNDKYIIIDTPGIYSFSSSSKAEEIANKTMDEGDIIINILDSTNLERNLNLTLQVIKKRKPMILVLNIWDETKHKGIVIDYKKLEEILNIPVIPTCAITGQGIKELVERVKEARISNFDYKENEKWEKIGEIINQVQKIYPKHHLFSEIINELTFNHFTGLPVAFFILLFSFIIIRFTGEGLINYVLDPIFNKFYMPFLIKINNSDIPLLIKHILIGKNIEPMESFGVLSTGLYIPFVVVLPYIISFYIVLSFLEDSGYLPRLSVLLDNFLHKLGIHGYSSIPILLGIGCKVPGFLSIRILESEREKIITALLILISAPCMPQTAMIITLGMHYGLKVVLMIFFLLLLISIITAYFLNKLLKGESQELFIEIPPYRIPDINILAKKLWMRLRNFIFEAIPLIILGIFLINIMDITGLLNYLSKTFGKFFTVITGLPEEMASVMLLGFLRKDVSISMLAPFNLTAKQFIIASIFLVMYLPCVASFFTLNRELGIKSTTKLFSLIFILSLIVAMLLNFLIKL